MLLFTVVMHFPVESVFLLGLLKFFSYVRWGERKISGMPFVSAQSSSDLINSLKFALDREHALDDSKLQELNAESVRHLSDNPNNYELREELHNFQVKYHSEYIRKHNLQKFLNQLVQHAVRTKTSNPICELISAIDKKIIQ